MTEHASDCAIYNEPAHPSGPCDCGALAITLNNNVQLAWHSLRDAIAAEYAPLKDTPAGRLAMEMWREGNAYACALEAGAPTMVGQTCTMGKGTAITGPFAPAWATYLRDASRVLDLLERAKTRAAS